MVAARAVAVVGNGGKRRTVLLIVGIAKRHVVVAVGSFEFHRMIQEEVMPSAGLQRHIGRRVDAAGEGKGGLGQEFARRTTGGSLRAGT